jgi:cell division septal protein FtsQ
VAAQPRAEGKVLPFDGAPDWGRLVPSARILLIGFGLVGLAALLYVVARETPMFAVRRIEVEGAPPRVAAHVRRALAPLRGKSLLALGRGDVEPRLAALPDVAATSYDRAFPSTLRVMVRPERPVTVVRQGSSSWLVSAGARVIRAVSHGAAPRLPRIWVGRSASVGVGDVLSDADARRAVRALALVRALPVHARFVRANDNELTLILRSGLELRLGNDRALPLKLAIARSILPSLSGASPPYTYLDVSVPERPVAGSKP